MRSFAKLFCPRPLAFLVVALAATSSPAQIHSPQVNLHHKAAAEDLSWLWQFAQPAPQGRENDLLHDPRFQALLKQHLTAPQSFWQKGESISEVAQDFLGIPGAVIGDDNRYLSVDGCLPHFCPNRGLVWIDLALPQPLIVFNAIDWITENRATDDKAATYTLWVFASRALDPAHPPQGLVRSLARWTSQPSSGATELQNVTRVYFVDPDGTPHPVTPGTVGAHSSLPAETTTGMETGTAPATEPKVQ